MADRTIGQLPELSEISDTSLLPVEDSGTAYHTTGASWKSYVQNAISSLVALVQSAANRADDDATRAETAAASALADKTAIQGMGVSSVVLQAGSTPTLTKTESGGVWNLVFGLVPGPKGDTGQRGRDGDTGPQGPPGPVSSAGSVEAATGLFTFSIGNSTAQATLGEPGHLLLTYAGAETQDTQWSIDFEPSSPTYGHLLYNPDAT